MSIKILDCTLRDGGYINDWQFGRRRITGVINGLTVAGVDIVECGFLQSKTHSTEQSLYNSVKEVESVLPLENESTEYVAMMDSGAFDVSKLSLNESSKLSGIRVVFHENQADAALEECRLIKEKGYKAFLQPMGTDAYSDKALLGLIEKANEIEPYAFYFVDSLGVMNGDDVIRLALLIHNNLKASITLGFHTHNNLQLAYSNIQKLISMSLKRDIIVDSSVYGMGRGAGNLNTELIASYLNENFETDYDVDQILRVYDEYIRSLREEFTWGYSIPYYLAAVHKCHPNYGTYMINRATLPVTDVGLLLSKIPTPNKRFYSEKLIEDLYVDFIANKVDDSKSYEELKQCLLAKQILLLGPGKSLVTHTSVINDFIAKTHPVVITVNHVTDKYPINYAFYSNRKRFEEQGHASIEYILTSNVISAENNSLVFDYMTLCNQWGVFSDNSALMLISLLLRLGCESVSVAGLDGYSGDDYYERELQNISDHEWQNSTNSMVTKAIMQYAKNMTINFITPSIYDKGLK